MTPGPRRRRSSATLPSFTSVSSWKLKRRALFGVSSTRFYGILASINPMPHVSSPLRRRARAMNADRNTKAG